MIGQIRFLSIVLKERERRSDKKSKIEEKACLLNLEKEKYHFIIIIRDLDALKVTK